MNQTDLVFQLDEEKTINEKISNQSIFKNYFPILFFSNENNLQFPFKTYNQQFSENITLEQIKNIIDEPKLDLNEEEDLDTLESIYFIKKQNNSKIELQSTDTTTKQLSLLSQDSISVKKEDNLTKKINFKTMLYHKRGRKQMNNSGIDKRKKCHGSGDFDNIQRKIQVHYMNFLISLGNDILKSILGKKIKFQFKDVKYEIKKIVNHNNLEHLKTLNYSDILQMEISPKNKKLKEDNNKNIYKNICQNSEILKKIFDKKYIYIFQKYYYTLKNNEKEIDFDGIKINLNTKTKAFFNLLKKNENEKEKFMGIVEDVYFSNVNYLIEKKFFTTNFGDK